MSGIVKVGNVYSRPIPEYQRLRRDVAEMIRDAEFRRDWGKRLDNIEAYERNQTINFDRQLQEKQKAIDKVQRITGQNRATADSALTKATSVDKKVTQGLTNVVSRGEFRQTINAQARRIETAQSTARNAVNQVGRVAKDASTAKSLGRNASNLAKNAAGLGTKALNILSIVGGAAGLISLFGFFKATRPTLDAHEARMDAQSQALSDNLSLIGQNRSIAKRADRNAAQALDKAKAAQQKADRAAFQAKNAEQDAGIAIANARDAARSATAATERANIAQKQANTAIESTKVNAAEIDRLGREQTAMNNQQFTQLKQQNDAAIGQNNRLQKMVTELGARYKDPAPIPIELLGMPAAVNDIQRNTNTIARNTTASAQQANSRAGTCQAFAPGQCGDQSVSRNIRPAIKKLEEIADWLNRLNAFMINTLGKKIDQLTSITLSMRSKIFRKFDQTWDYLKMDRVLNVLSTAATLHNAAMLSRNAAESIVFAIDGILQIVGFKDAEGNPFSLSSQISAGVTGLINKTIGKDAAKGVSEKWNSWNRIISAGAAVIQSLQSMQYAIADGVEMVINGLAHVANGLRENGMVEDRQWPWQKDNRRITRFSKINRFVEGLETAENFSQNIYGAVATGAEVVDSVHAVKAAKQQFDETLAEETAKADTGMDERNSESESPPITPFDTARMEPEEVPE